MCTVGTSGGGLLDVHASSIKMTFVDYFLNGRILFPYNRRVVEGGRKAHLVRVEWKTEIFVPSDLLPTRSVGYFGSRCPMSRRM